MTSTPSTPDQPPATDGPAAPVGATPSDDSGGGALGVSFFLLLIAVFVGFLGVRAYFDVRAYDPSAPPVCGGEPMTRRDECWFSGHGDGSYDDEVRAAADKHVQDIWIRNLGLPATGVLLLMIVFLIRSASRAVAVQRTKEEPHDEIPN